MMTAKKPKICLVTTSRADYGIYASVLKQMQADDVINFSVLVGGMHLAKQFGMTVSMIENDGYDIAARVPCMDDGDRDVDIADAMGMAVGGFGWALNDVRPDLIIVLGDRYEMHAAALAALPFRIPVAHIHGGEETEGAIDNALRHSMTKLSHLHFTSTKLAAQRIGAMGEDPSKIFVSGAPALDTILATKTMSRREWGQKFSVPEGDFVLVTYHPVTLSPEKTLEDFEQVWQAMQEFGMPIVLTLSNADTSGQTLNARLRELAGTFDNTTLVENMGAHGYYSAMQHATVMVGNSSSGIIEAASFGLPVLNIGDRQKGREASPNLIQVNPDKQSIKDGLKESARPDFARKCAQAINVYGDGTAANVICREIKSYIAGNNSVQKPFHMAETSHE